MSGGRGPGPAAGPRARWARWLGLDPAARAWRYRWVAYLVLALGSLMVAANAFAAASAGSPAGWVWAAVNGSWAAGLALGFGAACALLAMLIARARR